VDPTRNLMDVCVMLKEEWDSVSETTIAQCGLKAELLLADTAALLRSRHGCSHPGLPRMNAEVAEIVAMMGAFSASARPNSPADAADCVLEAVEWLDAEDLPATVFETASRIESTLDESDTENVFLSLAFLFSSELARNQPEPQKSGHAAGGGAETKPSPVHVNVHVDRRAGGRAQQPANENNSRRTVGSGTVERSKTNYATDRCDWPGELNITSSTLLSAPQGQARLTHDSELPLLQIPPSPSWGAAVANLEPATSQN